MAQEIELKLELSDGAAATFARWDGLPERADVKRLRSIYFDTSDGQLAEQGWSLRIRTSGKRRIQTVKADGGTAAGLFARREWERPVDDEQPVIDEDMPVAALLGDAAKEIAPAFEVDVERARWVLTEGEARVELVLDRGVVRAGEREAALCEIELELLAGAPAALFAIGRRIDGEVPVRPGVLSKAERGYRLREAMPEAFKAEPVALDPGMRAGDAFLRIAQSCLRHYRLNEGMLLERYEGKALHQARVAIRRLRSAIGLFKPILPAADVLRFQADLRWLAGVLGEARDIDVLAGRIEDQAVLPLLDEARETAHRRVLEWLHSARVRMLLLDLVEWLALAAGRGEAGDEPATDFAVVRLRRLRRKVVKGGRDIADLPDEVRHKVRKDAKKLRYSTEFFFDLFPKGEQRRRHRKFIVALEALQEKLGDLNDLATAPALLARLGLAADTDLGLKRRAKLLAGAAEAHAELADVRKFWK